MDTDYCRRLVESRVQGIEIRTCESIVEGWSSHVLDVNGELIFRFPRRPEIAQLFEKEIAILPLLAAALPVQVPRFNVVVRDAPDGPVVFVGYDKIQGQQLGQGALHRGSARRSLARDLGVLLSALHRIPLAGLAAAHVKPVTADDWRREYRELYDRAQRGVFPLLSAGAQRAESAVWRGFLDDDDNFRFAPVFVHADLGPEHIICDEEERTVVGVIDWEDAQVGDPALDITGLLYDLGEAFTHEVLGSYAGDSDRGLLTRARFYARVVPYHQVWFGRETGQPDHVRRGLRAIEANAALG